MDKRVNHRHRGQRPVGHHSSGFKLKERPGGHGLTRERPVT